MTRIVVGVDGSEHARKALAWAVEEARLRGSSVEAAHVYDDTPAYELYRYPGGLPTEEESRQRHERAASYAQQLVEEMIEQLGAEPGAPIKAMTIADRRPARALIELADADMLVVGSRGRGGFSGLVLGSVSQQCVQHARGPVTVVPAERGAEQQAD